MTRAYMRGIATCKSFITASLLPRRGLEPLRIAPPDPKSGASANFATSAGELLVWHRMRECQTRATLKPYLDQFRASFAVDGGAWIW
jgi:hypothetical protein